MLDAYVPQLLPPSVQIMHVFSHVSCTIWGTNMTRITVYEITIVECDNELFPWSVFASRPVRSRDAASSKRNIRCGFCCCCWNIYHSGHKMDCLAHSTYKQLLVCQSAVHDLKLYKIVINIRHSYFSFIIIYINKKVISFVSISLFHGYPFLLHMDLDMNICSHCIISLLHILKSIN